MRPIYFRFLPLLMALAAQLGALLLLLGSGDVRWADALAPGATVRQGETLATVGDTAVDATSRDGGDAGRSARR